MPDDASPTEPLIVEGRDPQATARAEILPILVFFFLAPLAVGLLVVGHVVLKDLPWYDTRLAILGWIAGCVAIGALVERQRRLSLALQGRVACYPDRLELTKSSGRAKFSRHAITGYRPREVHGYVQLEVEGRWSWIGHALPSSDEAGLVALLAHLDTWGIERKG